MRMNRKIAGVLAALVLLSGCAADPDRETGEESKETSASQAVSKETSAADSDNYNKKDFYTDYNKTKCTKISLGDGSIRIVRGGTYLLSGELTDGQVVIEADKTEDVRLVLNNVRIHSENGPAIYASRCDKLIISLAPGTVNTLSDRKTAADDNGKELSGCIFCRDNLTMNGSGTLNVEANAKDGIVCRDRLIIMEGTYCVTAADDAIVGKEELIVRDGSFTLTSGGDGMKASEDTDESLGYVKLLGGNYSITAENDAVQAETDIIVSGGNYSIITGGGAENSDKHPEEKGFDMHEWDPDRKVETEDSSVSRKGLKAGRSILISGGVLDLNTADDSLHAGGNIEMSGGELTVSSGDDALSADEELLISGGLLTIRESWEGLEAARIFMSGGEVSLKARDDGVNATGDNGTNQDKDPFSPDESAWFSMTGGTLMIDACGDGIDSNGDLTISGGELKISGPSSNGDGYFDATGTFTLTGGQLIAAGSYGMIEYPDTVGQAFIAVTGLPGKSGDAVSIRDPEGRELLHMTAARDYGSVFASDPGMKSGEYYTVYINESAAEKAEASDCAPESWQKMPPVQP